jgi:predicted enzyme related to lactoylglutathione lyase
MPRVVHFEVSADDTERASRFYSNVFGWEIQKWGGPKDYWLVSTGTEDQPGINGGLFKRDGPVNYVNTIDVPSVDDYVARITEHGGRVVVPKTTIPGVGYLVYCQDTENNVFGIMQEDRSVQ